MQFQSLFIFVFLLFLNFQQSWSQDNSSIVNPSQGLEKGNYSFSIGMNFGQYVTKNEDNFIYYTIDEKNIKYNVKFLVLDL